MDKDGDLDIDKECAKCRQSAKKWLRRSLIVFAISIVFAMLYFLNVPGKSFWSLVSCIGFIYSLIAFSYSVARYFDQMNYASWGSWF